MDRSPPTCSSPADAATQGPLPGRVSLLLLVIMALHAILAIWAASDKSVTADEILHVTQGFFANRHGDFRVQPENGILPQRLHGLAALATGAPTPELAGNEAWLTASTSIISHQFFYETGHDHFPMLMVARSLNVLFSLGTAGLVFWWARRLAGTAGGLLAAACYALDPNVLAHAALATSDLAAVFFLLLSATLFWAYLAKPGWMRLIGSALVVGLAFVSKFSAVLLLPLLGALGVLRIAADASRARWAWRAPLAVAVHAIVVLAVIWAAYGFRYSGFSGELPGAGHYAARWEEVLPTIGLHGKAVAWSRELRLLPEPFLYGYSFVVQASRARSAFLAGEYSIFGWPEFFPLAFLWKTTLAVLVALVPAVLCLALRWWRQRSRIAGDLWCVAPLAAFFLLYWGVSLTTHLNIGHRHILPTYPVLYVLLGAWLASLALPRPARSLAICLLIAGQALACARTAPHFLAYFNSFAGGPANGYRLLVDSSLDWGQDLAGLDRWLEKNNSGPAAEPVYLSYFGSGEPNYYGIRATRLPFINGFKFMHPRYEPRPGLYCIGATMLQQVYSRYRGPWTPDFEHAYRRLRNQAASLPEWPQARWQEYDELRFARLCHQLRARAPDDMIGHSILVYRVSARELALALDGDMAMLGTPLTDGDRADGASHSR